MHKQKPIVKVKPTTRPKPEPTVIFTDYASL